LLDAVHLEERGIPTVTFVTEPFESAARTHAEILGLPGIPLVVIPSDYIDGSDEVVAEKIAPRIEEVLTKLLVGPEGE
jgi:hypothetical protein